MRAEIYNGGAFCRSAYQAVGITAETETNGVWVSRLDGGGVVQSAKLLIPYEVTFTAAGETLSVAANFQDAVDSAGVGAADYGDLVPSTILKTATGAGVVTGVAEIDVNLSGAREFIRSQVTVVASGSAATIKYGAALILFGEARQPATKAIASV